MGGPLGSSGLRAASVPFFLQAVPQSLLRLEAERFISTFGVGKKKSECPDDDQPEEGRQWQRPPDLHLLRSGIVHAEDVTGVSPRS